MLAVATNEGSAVDPFLLRLSGRFGGNRGDNGENRESGRTGKFGEIPKFDSGRKGKLRNIFAKAGIGGRNLQVFSRPG